MPRPFLLVELCSFVFQPTAHFARGRCLTLFFIRLEVDGIILIRGKTYFAVVAHFAKIGGGEPCGSLEFIDEVLAVGKPRVGADLIQRHIGIEQQLLAFFDAKVVDLFDDGRVQMFLEKTLQVCFMDAHGGRHIVHRNGLHKILADIGLRLFEVNDA